MYICIFICIYVYSSLIVHMCVVIDRDVITPTPPNPHPTETTNHWQLDESNASRTSRGGLAANVRNFCANVRQRSPIDWIKNQVE